MSFVFWIAVGCLIGWNMPQPTYAKVAQEWVVGLFNKAKGTLDKEE
jgi:hypothetical protein